MTETIDVALCQFELGEARGLEEVLDRADALFERAGPADVYVLPELFVVELEDAAPAALDAGDRERLNAVLGDAAMARDALVVGGSYHAAVDGGIVNRCPIAGPDGAVLTYDKCHPIPAERDVGTLGGPEAPPVVGHAGADVGVLICYDVEFPETVRGVVDRGAELLVVPSWTRTEAGHQRVRRCAAARAVENQAYVATVPLVGEQPATDRRGTGRASVFAPCDDVVGPNGTRLSLPRDVAAAGVSQLDLEGLRRSREAAEVGPYADYRDATCS